MKSGRTIAANVRATTAAAAVASGSNEHSYPSPLRGGGIARLLRALCALSASLSYGRAPSLRGFICGARTPSIPAHPEKPRGEAPQSAGAERRTSWPALRSGRSLAGPRDRASGVGRRALHPPDPAGFRPRSSFPVQPSKAAPRSWSGRLPEASRTGVCETPARAPHPAPPARRLMTAPSVSGVIGIKTQYRYIVKEIWLTNCESFSRNFR